MRLEVGDEVTTKCQCHNGLEGTIKTTKTSDNGGQYVIVELFRPLTDHEHTIDYTARPVEII